MVVVHVVVVLCITHRHVDQLTTGFRWLLFHVLLYSLVSFLFAVLLNVWGLLLLLLFLAHQHKAAGRKTRLDIQNYGCKGNLLCYHGVVERNCISSLQCHGKALEKECCLPGYLL